jgi:hypothetical protein
MRWRGALVVALALCGAACGPPTPTFTSDADSAAHTESDDGSSSSSSSSETGAAETSTTETDSTDTAATLPFVPEHDLRLPDVAPCDPAQQDCPDGQKCVPYGSTGELWDTNKCVPVLGEQAPGEPCTYAGTVESTDDCDATSFCWNVQDVDGEAIGTCAAFCTDSLECPSGDRCLTSNCDCLYLCIDICDPILQDCGDGLACYWADDGFGCFITTMNFPPGEPCGYFFSDCVAGSGCIPGEVLPSCEGAACCSPWCELGAGDLPCEVLPGTTCVPFFEHDLAPPGYEHVGVCLAPP